MVNADGSMILLNIKLNVNVLNNKQVKGEKKAEKRWQWQGSKTPSGGRMEK